MSTLALGAAAPDATLAAPSSLDARVLPVSALETDQRNEMYALYRRYYDATDARRFHLDLDAKDRVVAMYDPGGRLRGFSSLAVLSLHDDDGRDVRAIYSGDTIVDHRFWGQQALAFTWIRLAGSIARERPDVPLFWFLIVKGHRTYRYLNAFTRRYFPSWRAETPSQEQALMDRLAGLRFGAHYDADSGLVRYPHSRGHLAAPWAEIDPTERERPEVEYFLRRNPHYANGDELVCLTRLATSNLRPLARRLFEQGTQQ